MHAIASRGLRRLNQKSLYSAQQAEPKRFRRLKLFSQDFGPNLEAMTGDLNERLVQRLKGTKDNRHANKPIMPYDPHLDRHSIFHRSDNGTDSIFHKIDGFNQLS